MTDTPYAPVVVLRMPNWLGDAIMALPALDLLAREIPQAAIVVSCRPNLMDLFRSHPSVWGIIPAPKHGIPGLVKCCRPYRMIEPTEEPIPHTNRETHSEGKTIMRRIPVPLALRFTKINTGGSFDAGALFPNSLSSAVWLWKIGAKHRVGYNRNARGLFLNKRIPITNSTLDRHLTEYYLTIADETVTVLSSESSRWPSFPPQAIEGLAKPSFFSAADLADMPRDPVIGIPIPILSIPARGEKEATFLMREAGMMNGDENVTEAKMAKHLRILTIAPMSAYGAIKDWPSHYYTELVKRYTAGGWHVFVTGSESQWSVCAEIASVSPNAVNVAGRTTLAGLLALIKRSDLFIGGDSGAAHAAAALGIRTVAIYGVTEPARTRQLGLHVRIVGVHEERFKAALNHEVPTSKISARLETNDSLDSPKMAALAKELLEGIAVDRVVEAAQELRRPPSE